MKKILNPFLYIKKYLDFSIVYSPYKHKFFLFTNSELKDIKRGIKKDSYLTENRILVDKGYRKKFIENYRKSINEIKPELNLMYLLLTDNCNFRCPYCFIEGNYKNKERSILTWENAEKAIDYFFNNSESEEKRIIFYGGEPLLNKNVLIKSINKIRKYSNKTHIGINTNGSIYDKELSRIFKNNDVIISVSIDGFEKINDKTRINYNLQGTSKEVIENIDKYIADGVNVSFSITINSHNIDYLPSISEWISKRFNQVKSIGFNLPLESIKGNKLFVDPEYCAFQLYNSYRILRGKGIYEDRILRRLKYIINEKPYLKDCGACGNQIVIHPSGLVGPCHGFSGIKKYFDYKINNLNFKEGEVFKKWNHLSPINKKYCLNKNCPFILICGNSCPYYSELTGGSLDSPDNRMYPFLSLLIEEFGKDLYLKPPKAIAIDYDGTIISREPAHEIIEFVAKRYGYTKEIIKQDYYDIREIFNVISEELGKKDKVNDMIYLYLKKWKENSRINTPLINQLKKIKEEYNLSVYILSRNKKENIIKELNEIGVNSNIFDGVFESNKFKKPALKYFKEFFKKVNINPEELIYIGDSYHSDIKPIYSLGIRGAISFYANPAYFDELNNEWLVDIFKDYFSLKNGKSKNI